MTEPEFIEYLTYYTTHQRLWESIFPDTDDVPHNLPQLINSFFAEGRYDLAMHAVYCARYSHEVAPALESMFVSLIAEKAQREGITVLKNLFLQALENAHRPESQ